MFIKSDATELTEFCFSQYLFYHLNTPHPSCEESSVQCQESYRMNTQDTVLTVYRYSIQKYPQVLTFSTHLTSMHSIPLSIAYYRILNFAMFTFSQVTSKSIYVMSSSIYFFLEQPFKNEELLNMIRGRPLIIWGRDEDFCRINFFYRRAYGFIFFWRPSESILFAIFTTPPADDKWSIPKVVSKSTSSHVGGSGKGPSLHLLTIGLVSTCKPVADL